MGSDMQKKSFKSNEMLHDANNAFVKKHQTELLSKGIKKPMLEEKCMQFNACMTNTGEAACNFARDVTAGLDKEAFPVK